MEIQHSTIKTKTCNNIIYNNEKEKWKCILVCNFISLSTPFHRSDGFMHSFIHLCSYTFSMQNIFNSQITLFNSIVCCAALLFSLKQIKFFPLELCKRDV